LLREGNSQKAKAYEPLLKIGLDAESMVRLVNQKIESDKNIQCRQIIISGGINNFLDGYYLMQLSKLPSVYGQASAFLSYAKKSYDQLYKYAETQVKGLRLARAFLRIIE
jgi:isopentenyl-diphosphate delta-isomerase